MMLSGWPRYSGGTSFDLAAIWENCTSSAKLVQLQNGHR
jgi:hypothetical protein